MGTKQTSSFKKVTDGSRHGTLYKDRWGYTRSVGIQIGIAHEDVLLRLVRDSKVISKMIVRRASASRMLIPSLELPLV